MKTSRSPVSALPPERIEKRIFLLRGQKIMLDEDLATLYGVSVKVLNQAVRRNRFRFPTDFMFQLSAREYMVLRSQTVTLDERGRGRHRKYLPPAPASPISLENPFPDTPYPNLPMP